MTLDNIILEPLAKGYNKLPSPLRKGTSNFTSNIGTLLSIPNNIMQGNLKQLGHSVGSFAVNTTVGILGFFNPAERMGLKPNKEDVGQTLGSTELAQDATLFYQFSAQQLLGDSVGLIADTFVDPFAHVTLREKELLGASGNNLDYYSMKATTAIDFRADNDKNFESLEKNSIDLYSSMKSIYLQDRENKIKNSIEDSDEWGSLDGKK